jgi:DNA-binding transcriptional LysR family regulator
LDAPKRRQGEAEQPETRPEQPPVAAGALRVVLGDYEFFDPSIHAIWPPNRQLSAKVRAFVDFLTARFGGVPYWDRPFSHIA